MALDEWLMSQVGEGPILRIYEWEGDWVSLGCFQSLAEAKRIFGDEVSYVRRWTGGGIVDHRGDRTYTLAISRVEEAASLRGGESYCAIHRAVAACLRANGAGGELAGKDSGGGSAACFENPVQWDILDGGQKVAGAGQRRSREGILHQGSVLGEIGGLERFLAEDVIDWDASFPKDLSGRYATGEWLEKI